MVALSWCLEIASQTRKQIGFGVWWVCLSFFNDNLKTGKDHKLLTYNLLQNLLIDKTFISRNYRHVFILLLSKLVKCQPVFFAGNVRLLKLSHGHTTSIWELKNTRNAKGSRSVWSVLENLESRINMPKKVKRDFGIFNFFKNTQMDFWYLPIEPKEWIHILNDIPCKCTYDQFN